MGEDEQETAALLTQAQRAYLRDKKEYRPATERQVRRRIRRRVRAALETDLPLLADEYDLTDFADSGETNWGPALRETIAFAAMVATAADLDVKRIAEEGLNQARNTRTDAILQKLEENPDDVTIGELSDLRSAGELSREEYEELFRDSLRPPNPGVTSQERLDELDLLDTDDED